MKAEKAMSKDALLAVNSSRRLIYAFLSRMYETEVTTDLLKELSGENSPITRFAVSKLEEGGLREGFEMLSRYLGGLGGRDLENIRLELAVEYANLFLGVKGKPSHPSESAYRSEDHSIYQGPRDEVLRAYWNSGADRVKGFTEPEDHIAMELQFMAFLCRRTVETLEKDEKVEVKKNLQAQKDFIDNHLAKWVPGFTKDILETARVDFYRGVACLTSAFIESDRNAISDLIQEVESLT